MDKRNNSFADDVQYYSYQQNDKIINGTSVKSEKIVKESRRVRYLNNINNTLHNIRNWFNSKFRKNYNNIDGAL